MRQRSLPQPRSLSQRRWPRVSRRRLPPRASSRPAFSGRNDVRILADVRFAARLLRRAPGFTVAVVTVLALGIGANSAIFTALDRTVIRPLPYAEPDRLAALWEDFSSV